jgi:hypothetical protein
MVWMVWKDALGLFVCIFRRSIHRFFHCSDMGLVKERVVSPDAGNSWASRLLPRNVILMTRESFVGAWI